MCRRDRVTMRRSPDPRVGIVFVLSLGTLLLAGTHSAMAQVDYTGVPSSSSQDTYLGTYVGPASAVGTAVAGTAPSAASVPQGGAGRTASVAGAPLPDSVEASELGERSVVTGWDLVTIGALGLTAVIAFALSAGRFRRF